MSRIRTIKPEFWRRNGEVWDLGCSLYVVQEDDSYIKVGISEHPIRRLSTLQCGNSRKLHLRAVFCGDRPACRDMEKCVSKYFKDNLVRGEWLTARLSDVVTFIGVGAT
jgi:hypothetical protein